MKNVTKQKSFLFESSDLYEIVSVKNGVQQYCKYNTISGNISLQKSVTIDQTEYVPPEGDLVLNGTIKLPAYPTEYRDTSVLFDDIRYFISKYVDLPQAYLTMSALYVMLSWVYDCFEVLPYLRVIGNFGTGKSRFLQTVGSLCYKACFAGGASTVSPIFRIIDLYGGVTLIFDEADFAFSGETAEMVKILNCGYMKGMPVLRTEGDKNKVPTSFNVYGAKILATRNRYQDLALESRCLSHVMTGKHRKDIPIHLPRDFEDQALELRNKLLLFRFRNYGEVLLNPALKIEGVDSRINQIILPILSLISDEKVTEEVNKFIDELKESVRDGAVSQDQSLILQALINLIQQGSILKYSAVADEIDKIAEHTFSGHLITPTKIGHINRSNFNLKTRQVRGVTEFVAVKENIQQIQELAKQYGIEVEDVDLVDTYFGAETPPKPSDLYQETAKYLS